MTKEQNTVLEFIDRLHAFEREHNLFSIEDANGLKYWDVVRSKIFIRLYNQFFPPPVVDVNISESAKSKKGFKWLSKLVSKTFAFVHWWIINEVNFYVKAKKRDWVILKVSRFIHPETRRPSDAVMDEIEQQLPHDQTLVVESFNNSRFGKMQIRKSPFFIYKLWYVKEIYKTLGLGRNRRYQLSALLEKNFGQGTDWNAIISNEITAFYIDYKFGVKMFKRVKPVGFFFSGLQKGLTKAAHDLSIPAIEIQHSPLNSADIVYSYSNKISYEGVNTMPKFLLTNSLYWNDLIFYPPKFVNIGSDYFYKASCAKDRSNPDHLLVISGPGYTNLLIKHTLALINCNPSIPIFFKLHSAEFDSLPTVSKAFENYRNVTVIFNEKNINELMQLSFAVMLTYSTVAYQALQMGLSVIILKVGYYEGQYDLLDLSNVYILDDSSGLTGDLISKIKSSEKKYEFFDPLHALSFQLFIKGLKHHAI